MLRNKILHLKRYCCSIVNATSPSFKNQKYKFVKIYYDQRLYDERSIYINKKMDFYIGGKLSKIGLKSETLLPYKFIRPHKHKAGDIKFIWDRVRGYELPWVKQRTRKLADFLFLGYYWSSTMEVSIRLINMHIAASITNEVPNYSFAKMHFAYIRNNLELPPFGSRNNHYLISIVALFIHSACYQFKDRDYYFQLLLDEIKRQFHDDGTNFEGSTSYHFLSTEALVCAYLFMSNCERKIGKTFINKSLGVCEILLRANGTIPYIGDNDSGRILKLYVCVENGREVVEKYNYFLNFSAGNGLTSERPAECSFDSKGHLPLNLYKQKIIEIANKESCRTYYLKGFSIFVITNGNLIITFKAGALPKNNKNGHLHNDQLSFTLVCGDKVLADDPGTQSYANGEKERLRSVKFHNNLVFSHQVDSEVLVDNFSSSFPTAKLQKNTTAIWGKIVFAETSLVRVVEFKEGTIEIYDLTSCHRRYQAPFLNDSRIEYYGQR